MGGYAVSVLRGPHGIPRMQENQRQIREAEQTNEELKRRIQDLNQENERLLSNPEERDKAVRKHTNKQKPGETTIMLSPDTESEEAPKVNPEKN